MVHRSRYTPKWISPEIRHKPKVIRNYIWTSKPPVRSKLLLLYIPSQTIEAAMDSAVPFSCTPPIITCILNWNGEQCPFCNQIRSSLQTACAALNSKSKLTSWVDQLRSRAGASQRYSSIGAPGVFLSLKRLSDKLLSYKDGLLKLQIPIKPF